MGGVGMAGGSSEMLLKIEVQKIVFVRSLNWSVDMFSCLTLFSLFWRNLLAWNIKYVSDQQRKCDIVELAIRMVSYAWTFDEKRFYM